MIIKVQKTNIVVDFTDFTGITETGNFGGL